MDSWAFTGGTDLSILPFNDCLYMKDTKNTLSLQGLGIFYGQFPKFVAFIAALMIIIIIYLPSSKAQYNGLN